MNSQPLLTIAIPTYNRPETLKKILEELTHQTDRNFLVLIADDFPQGNQTEKMVASYLKKFSNIKYLKNKKNLGYSGNVCHLFESAETKYVWFLCDDDTVLPEAVENINRSLQKYKPVVAIYNYSWIDSYGKRALAGVTKDIVHDNYKKFTDYQALTRTTFLSICVMEKRRDISAIKKTDYQSNIFFQVTLALYLLSNSFKFCEISSPILHRNVGYKYGEFFKFYLVDFLKAVQAVPTVFLNSQFVWWAKLHLPTAFQLYMSQKLGLFRYHGEPTKETVRLIKKYYGILSLFIFSFPFIYKWTPTIILKTIYLLQLIAMHGYKKGKQLYKLNINRAYKDERKTGFTEYK